MVDVIVERCAGLDVHRDTVVATVRLPGKGKSRSRRLRETRTFGTTIGHGFLTLSLCVPMLYELLPPSEGMMVNYGVDRVRFPAAVPSGSRVRGRVQVVSVDSAGGRERATIDATVECDGVEKPVCVARLVVLTVS